MENRACSQWAHAWRTRVVVVLVLATMMAQTTCTAAPRVYKLLDSQGSCQALALSPTGKWLAISQTVRHGPATRLTVYSTANGHESASLTGGVTTLVAWHPYRPLLAVPEEIWEGDERLRILDVAHDKSSKISEVSGPHDWFPDGRHLLTPVGSMLGMDDSNVSLPGLWGGSTAGGVSVSKTWEVAASLASRTTPNCDIIALYQKNTHGLSYKRKAVLVPDVDKKSRLTTSFRTRPGFLSSGRLGYVRVFLDTAGNRKRVEIWTCRADGRDERKWVALPVIPVTDVLEQGLDASQYEVTPVTWARDGKSIAYYYKGKVYLKSVKPPK